MHNRTRTLVKGLQRVTDVKLLTNRVEELSFHLLEFPEMRGVAVKVCLFVSLSLHPTNFRRSQIRRVCCLICFSGERAAVPVAPAPGQRPPPAGCGERSAGPGRLQRPGQRSRDSSVGHRRRRNKVNHAHSSRCVGNARPHLFCAFIWK